MKMLYVRRSAKFTLIRIVLFSSVLVIYYQIKRNARPGQSYTQPCPSPSDRSKDTHLNGPQPEQYGDNAEDLPWQCTPGRYDLQTLLDLPHEHRRSVGDSGQSILSDGTSGQVHFSEATDQPGSPLLAHKHFHPHDPSTESLGSYTAAIQKEYALSSSFRHQHLTRSVSLHESSNYTFIMSMPYIPYALTSLMQHAIDCGRSWTALEATCLFRQLLDGVAHLHSIGIAHRDLKLENVRVDARGVAKIIDFGSAAVSRDPRGDKILGAGAVGTDVYMPPEVYGETAYDVEKADVWSLAVIFVSMWIQAYPWEEAKLSDKDYRRFVQDFASGSGLNSGAEDCREGDEDGDGDTDTSMICQLPQLSRPIIRRMLDLDFAKRPDWAEIYEDQWLRSVPYQQDWLNHTSKDFT